MIKEDIEEVIPGVFIDVSGLDDLGDIYRPPFPKSKAVLYGHRYQKRNNKDEEDLPLVSLQDK